MKREPSSARVKRQLHDGVRHVINRDDVHPQRRLYRKDSQLARQIQPKRIVGGVEGPGCPRFRVANNHPWPEDGDGKRVAGRLHQNLALVLGLLVATSESELAGERVLRHFAGPKPADVRGGDVRQALESMVLMNGPA